MTQPVERTFAASPLASGRALWPHCLALVAILAVVGLWVDVDEAVFETDDGGLIMQVQQLAEHQTWWIDYPFAPHDPDGRYFPVAHSLYEDGEAATYAQRPLLVLLTAGMWSWGGVHAATLLGIAGVTVAALSAALIAGRVDPRAALPTFWLTGLASPLAFDALTLRGHGLVVGFTGIGLLASMLVLDSGRTIRPLPLATSFLAFMVAAQIRREAVLFAGALGVAILAIAVWERRRTPVASALAVVAGAATGMLIDRALLSMLLQRGPSGAPSGRSGSFIADRLDATIALILPGFSTDPVLPAALALGALAMTIVAVVRFLRNGDQSELMISTAIAAALLVVRELLPGDHLVRGLLPAFPIGVGGFVLGLRLVAHPIVRCTAIASLMYLAAIAATQYPIGGGIEWGSRYTFAGFPAVLVIVGVGLTRVARTVTLTGAPARVLALSTLLVAILPTVSALSTQQSYRIENASNLEAVTELAEELDSGVIVSTHFEVPRTAIDQFEEPGPVWLWARGDRIIDLVTLLDQQEHEALPLLTREPDALEERLTNSGWVFEMVEELPLTPDTVILGVIRQA